MFGSIADRVGDDSVVLSAGAQTWHNCGNKIIGGKEERRGLDGGKCQYLYSEHWSTMLGRLRAFMALKGIAIVAPNVGFDRDERRVAEP